MRNYRNALLAGVTAIAFAAGTGLACAQSQGAGGGQSTSSPQSMQGGGSGLQMNDHGKTGPSVGERGTHRGSNMSADRHVRTGGGKAAATGQTGMQEHAQGAGEKPSTAQKGAMRKTGEHATTAQMKGRTGAAEASRGSKAAVEGANVKLSSQQRNRIRETIIDAKRAPRAGHVDFDVRVGTAVPRGRIHRIHMVPVPEYLVRIEPRWRGLEYFVFRDEVVIVNPRSARIVAIVPA